MDMPMKDGMDKSMGNKQSYFKCPNCDAELCAEQMDQEKSEMKVSKKMPFKKMNASSMPMGDLKDKITKNPPAAPNMNAY